MALDISTALIIGTLCVMAWSIMYRYNITYRLAEDLVIGVFGGYTMYTVSLTTMQNYITPLTKGDLINIIPILAGVILWGQLLSPTQRWVARVPLAFITGVGSAIALKGAVYGNILTYVQAMATPPGYDAWTLFNFLVAAVATITTVWYFFFTVEAKGALKTPSTIGRWMMMLAFGSVAGSSVLSNATFIYNRAQFFLFEQYAWVPLVIGVIAIAVDIIRRKTGASTKQS